MRSKRILQRLMAELEYALETNQAAPSHFMRDVHVALERARFALHHEQQPPLPSHASDEDCSGVLN